MGGALSKGEIADYEADTVDDHDKGVWKGWVWHIYKPEGADNPTTGGFEMNPKP